MKNRQSDRACLFAHVCVATLMFAFAGATMAGGETPSNPAPYIGVWAQTRAQCGAPQTHAKAPMHLHANGYWQNTIRCRFAKVGYHQDTWVIEGICEVQGIENRERMRVQVVGDRLIRTLDGTTAEFVRCPSSE